MDRILESALQLGARKASSTYSFASIISIIIIILISIKGSFGVRPIVESHRKFLKAGNA